MGGWVARHAVGFSRVENPGTVEAWRVQEQGGETVPAGNLSRKAYLSAACSGRMKRGLGKADNRMLLTAVTHGPATQHGVKEAYKYDGTFRSLVSDP